MKSAAAALIVMGIVAVCGGVIYFASYGTPVSSAESIRHAMPQIGSDVAASTQAPARAPQSMSFQPPSLTSIPDNEFGGMVRLGQNIFEHPAEYASAYVGNDLRCSNCHLDAGRQADSAPMWAAFVSYPAYRSKNHHVNDFAERLQGCFLYSMNGKQPPRGSKVLVALESYSYWMAQGAPVDPNMAGRGYPKVAKPPLPPDYARGKEVFIQNCALCHGQNGAGRDANDGSSAFPALWGPASFNWGAGMHSLKNAVPFIKANMPLGKGNTLTDQQAWDVALFIDSHERPQDPRFTGSVAETRKLFHDSPNSMYGKRINDHVLGEGSVPPGGRLRNAADEGHASEERP